MKLWWIRALFCVTLALSGCSRSEAPAIEGNAAPDFTLKDLSGRDVSLSSLKGKVVLVNFWATWCPPCREEIPSMVRLNKGMDGQPFQMLAISVNDGGKKEVDPFLKDSNTVLPVLLDADQKVAKRYGTTGVPETFVVDKKGIIVKKVIGPLEWDRPEVVGALKELAAK
ncbi:TlpA family protein disulfide reductase [Geomonas sp. RF6]|uniref:TlpA disulfide reductase family protein n=1 Tax=Geomonas sp. RF6 TaxID=2897342 RepID=UPI001E354FC2|nr:TlpA disulfide reductase family protein [Geomonas sp. RF6]UFS72733.1 TlpA family protein disulfide reductase [Geomonas sp. RF6]